MKRKSTSPSDAQISEMQDLYTKHKHLGKVCELTGFNFRTVKKHLLAESERKRPTAEQIIAAYKVSGRVKRVSKIFNLGTVVLWRVMKRAGLELPKNSRNSKALYATLRGRIVRSTWRKEILKRDGCKCVRCGEKSMTVHHLTKLSEIRDTVFANNPTLNPFQDYKSLRAFTDLVMEAHKSIEGEVLCTVCHLKEHSNE